MRYRRVLTIALLCTGNIAARAQGSGPSLESYTGLLRAPSAWVQTAGTTSLLYTSAEGARYRSTATRTFGLSLGFIPYVEPSARVTDVAGAAVRDLSFNLKIQAPLDLLWPDLPFAFAIGTQDEGGAAAHFRTRYAVASARVWRFDASVGYGTGPDRLHGAFGGASLRIVDGAELLGEWDTRDVNAGARVSVPLDRIGIPVRLGGIAKIPVTYNAHKVEWGATLDVPVCLWTCTPPRARFDKLSANGEAGAARSDEPGRASTSSARTVDTGTTRFVDLQDLLVAEGLQEVRVGRDGELLVVEYENNRFNYGEADGLAVVLGEIANAGLGDQPVAVVVKRNGIRMAEVMLPAPVLRQAQHERSTWTWNPKEHNADWVSPTPQNRVALHSRLVLAPGLRSFIATDVGIFDYVLSFRPDLIVPLWPGATGYGRADVPFLWSKNLDDHGLLRNFREDPRIEYAMLYQALPVARGLMVMVGGGLYRSYEGGFTGEALWLPGDGAHAFDVQAAQSWDENHVSRAAATASWRGRYAPLDLVATVRAGRFDAGDEGVSVELSRWFGAVETGFFYSHTEVGVAGAFVSLPLTPRRDMRSGWLQVRGPAQWDHRISTVVGEKRNTLTAGLATPPMSPWNLESAYRDYGRLSRDGLLEGVR